MFICSLIYIQALQLVINHFQPQISGEKRIVLYLALVMPRSPAVVDGDVTKRHVDPVLISDVDRIQRCAFPSQ